MKNLEECYSYDKIFTYDHLYESYLKCRCGSSWKAMVQKFNSQANFNLYRIYNKLKNRKWKHGEYYDFDRIENGKLRHIQAEFFQDRVVQRCFCDYSLIPIISRRLIYDNSASQKGKGIDFALRRCKKHLQDHINKYGNEGYILQFDFHHYFENMQHNIVHKMLEDIYKDEDILKVAFSMIDKFKNGLGLGSQLSQTLALYFPNKLDHKIKEYFCIKGYGRYMDDGYVISDNKEKLIEILDYLKKWSIEYKIPLNEKKTHITKLSKSFTFLKKRFIINKNNRIIILVDKKNIHRMKRKVKVLKTKFDMDNKYIYQLVNSWTLTFKHYDCYKQLINIKNFTNKLIGVTKLWS